MINKINILYPGKYPLSAKFKKIILPQIKNKIPFIIKKVIPLSSLVNQDHLNGIEFDEQIYAMDYRHWYYGDDVFAKYVNKIAEMKPKRLCVFGMPFDYERPWKIDVETFSYKLFQRTETIVHTMREKSPDTLLIAPALSVINSECRHFYDSFFAYHGTLFDAYSVMCSNDMSDISIGDISSALVKNLKWAKIPVYLWCAVPSGQEVDTARIINDNRFVPLAERAAARKVEQLFYLFNNIADEVNLFYFGIDKDAFDPHRNPKPSDFWEDRLPIDLYVHDYKWNWFHFLGLIDHNDKVKTYLLKTLFDLADEHNVK